MFTLNSTNQKSLICLVVGLHVGHHHSCLLLLTAVVKNRIAVDRLKMNKRYCREYMCIDHALQNISL